jgi:regulator of replication initiation timing
MVEALQQRMERTTIEQSFNSKTNRTQQRDELRRMSALLTVVCRLFFHGFDICADYNDDPNNGHTERVSYRGPR